MRLTPLMLALTLMLSPALASCAAGDDGVTRAPSGLEVIALTISQSGTTHRFQVEVARTSAEQAQGLMERTTLAPDHGMLFPFPAPKFAAFWMRNTLIPLDMIFIRADGSIDRIAENTIPQSETPVASGGEVAAVLELSGGTAQRLGIDESATVQWARAAP
jgi:uncharacterized protein